MYNADNTRNLGGRMNMYRLQCERGSVDTLAKINFSVGLLSEDSGNCLEKILVPFEELEEPLEKVKDCKAVLPKAVERVTRQTCSTKDWGKDQAQCHTEEGICGLPGVREDILGK